jgi:hypothetical protein
VTREQAKHILLLYRPGTADWQDPDVAAAIDLARRDLDLAAWFQQHQAFQSAMRARFREIEVPEHLKVLVTQSEAGVAPAATAVSPAVLNEGRLSSGQADATLALPLVRAIPWWRTSAWFAAAVALVLLAALGTMWFRPVRFDKFINYEEMMVSTALRGYNMECVSPDMGQVRLYLAAKGAPADYRLGQGLTHLRLLGSAALTWRNHPVSMVCFDRPDKQKVWLFVLSRTALKDPPSSLPTETRISSLMTATWTEGDMTYVVAGPPEPGFVKKYL